MHIKRGQGTILFIESPALYSVIQNLNPSYWLVRSCKSIEIPVQAIELCGGCTIKLELELDCSIDLGNWILTIKDGSTILFETKTLVLE